VFRQISVCAGPFTLEAAEAVAGQGAAPVVARLVDCSLLSPPRTGADGRLRYSLLAGDLGEAVRWARQADQFPGDIPAVMARACSGWLAGMLGEAGDFAAAERLCAASLVASRDAGDLYNQPGQLSLMVMLDLRAGRVDEAAAHLREALQIALRTGNWVGDYLDYCGYLCAATRHYSEAVTAWAAHAALVPGGAWPGDVRMRQEPLRAARRALGPDRARAAEERGAAMARATAAEYALMVTSRGPQQPHARGPAGGSLSARELELVTLVAQGRTDAQIAAQLDISIRTVRSRLDRVRNKTGCRRRADLTRLALSAELV
jgi:DNA-binding CsgD family transcriptional regulator